ncbi:MAG: hypothetical protein HWE16_06850 [Gammaproteobacteria bacterium]|nr:hypothetical protein [Gammaproteobacteria bacterium]
MNKILIGLLALSIVGNAYLLIKPKEVVVEKSEPEKVVVKETEVVTLDDEELKEKHKALETKLSETELKLANALNELELIKDREALAKLSEEVSDENTIKAIEDGTLDEDFAKKIEQEREDTKKLFEKEAIDEAWAYQTQDAINNVIHEHGDVSLYGVSSLSCKTTICKVILKPVHNSEGAGMMAGMNASFALNKDETLKGYKTSFSFDHENNSQEVELFIHKGD